MLFVLSEMTQLSMVRGEKKSDAYTANHLSLFIYSTSIHWASIMHLGAADKAINNIKKTPALLSFSWLKQMNKF